MNKNTSILILLLVIVFFSCQKKTDPVDGSNVTVELRSGSKNVTGDITVNPKDSIFFDFTITSSQEMGFVSIQKNPLNQVAFVVRDTLNAAQKFSFSVLKKLVADSINGPAVYRIVAHTVRGNYIGHKDIVVTVNPDFNFYSNRLLYVPDSTAKTNKCYYSTSDGVTYSYSDGASKSSSIDFGYFYDTTRVGGVVNGHSIYALNAASSSIFLPYDITSWTRNATILKKVSAPTFLSLSSKGAIRTAGISNLASGVSSKVIGLSSSSPNNLVLFRTASGKYGCLQINFVNGATAAPSTYINVDVKVEK